MSKTPGQVAYEKWRELNHRLLAWERLRPGLRDEWDAIASAVIDQHIIDSDGDCSYDDWARLTGHPAAQGT